MLSYLRRFSILVLCTRVFSTTEKISVFKHIGIRVDESIFLILGGSLRLDMKVFASRAYPIHGYRLANLAICLLQLQTRHVCLFVMNTSPNRLQIILWYLQ